MMCSDGTFSHHISHITSIASKLTWWMLRTFQTRDRNCMVTLWKALVLPRLKYCCQLWTPHKTEEIIKIEALQRTRTNRIEGLQHLNYWERLERLKELRLYFLQKRWERYLVIYVWKTLEGFLPDVGLEINNHIRKGRLCYIKRTEATTQRMKTVVHNSFTKYGARLFNAVPKAIRELSDVMTDSFKHYWTNGWTQYWTSPQHQDTQTLHPTR